ncbi:MAG: MFS transporter [Chitinophagales bacterium]|nr:MFS transporter [Chitinophagales bacterium]
MNQQSNRILNAVVIVAALGYFVDIYDLLLFSIVRVPSLQSLGVEGDALKEVGLHLIDMQMFGMLLGGILWGVLGDKRGRLSVLFGSIFLYSIANIANGMVQSVEAYAAWRFIAGIGLAGELGAGITLVAEILPKEKRGLGTMVVAVVGLTGAIFAGLLAKIFDWRTCYFIGGGLGLALLALRVGVAESGMFKQTQQQEISRGNFFALFTNRSRFIRYMRCVFIGFPTWFVIGILVTFSPEFAKAMGVEGTINAGTAVMFAYGGLVAGDLVSGLLSQLLRSRIKVMYIFLALSAVCVFTFLNAGAVSPDTIYVLCGTLGFSVGFWVIFVTIAAEQFGTNLRATVTTTVPNFARGALVFITMLFRWAEGYFGTLQGAMLVGAFCIAISFLFLKGMKETFDEDLNYVEQV